MASITQSGVLALTPAPADGHADRGGRDADAGAAGATSRGQTGLLWPTDREGRRQEGRAGAERGGRSEEAREGNLGGVRPPASE